MNDYKKEGPILLNDYLGQITERTNILKQAKDLSMNFNYTIKRINKDQYDKDDITELFKICYSYYNSFANLINIREDIINKFLYNSAQYFKKRLTTVKSELEQQSYKFYSLEEERIHIIDRLKNVISENNFYIINYIVFYTPFDLD